MKEKEFECPVCGSTIALRLDHSTGEEAEIECPECKAALLVSSPEAEDSVVDVLECTVETWCPRDACGLDISMTIDNQDGQEEVICGACGATLEITWTTWGDKVDTVVVEPPPGEEEDLDIEDMDED